VVFGSDADAAAVKAVLEARLLAYAGKPVGVVVRNGAQMAGVLAGNPFAGAPGNRVMAIFLDRPARAADLEGIAGMAADEEVRLGRAEIYVRYGSGMAATKLRIPAAKEGTARNMNTVAKLASMAV